jgi:hypothetical protein
LIQRAAADAMPGRPPALRVGLRQPAHELR